MAEGLEGRFRISKTATTKRLVAAEWLNVHAKTFFCFHLSGSGVHSSRPGHLLPKEKDGWAVTVAFGSKPQVTRQAFQQVLLLRQPPLELQQPLPLSQLLQRPFLWQSLLSQQQQQPLSQQP